MDPFDVRVGARRTCVALGCAAMTLLLACAEYTRPSTRGGSGGSAGKSGAGGGGGAGAGEAGSGGNLSGSGGNASGSGGNAGSAGTAGRGGGASGGDSGAAGTAGSGGGSGGDGGDACPDDAMKTEPGSCGCGVEEDPACAALKEALIHRYSFEGTGDTVTDSIGAAHGEALGATLDDSGDLTLAGTTSDEYVDLPNGLVSGLEDATLEIWFTWSGGAAWQRLFDFGSTDMAEGTQGDGQTYLFLTPRAVDADGFLRVAFTSSGNENETLFTASAAASTSPETHVTVVVDATNDLLSVYQGGTLAGSEVFPGTLSELDDVNAWLGRSQYSADPEFAGKLHEFRIYEAALTAAEIAYSDAAGPDAAFLEP